MHSTVHANVHAQPLRTAHLYAHTIEGNAVCAEVPTFWTTMGTHGRECSLYK